MLGNEPPSASGVSCGIICTITPSILGLLIDSLDFIMGMESVEGGPWLVMHTTCADGSRACPTAPTQHWPGLFDL